MTVAPRIRELHLPERASGGLRRQRRTRRSPSRPQDAPGSGLKHALVIGAQHRLRPVQPGERGVRLRRARHRRLPRAAAAGRADRLGRLVQPRRRPAPGARARQGRSSSINGDAFSDEVKQETLARVAASGVKLDCVVYSLAAPKRTDETDRRHLQLGAEADRRAVPQRQHQPRQRPDPAGRDRARDRRRDRGDAQGDGRRGLRRLGAGAARRRSAGEGLPRRRLQLHRAGADDADLPVGHDRQGQGGSGGADRGAVGDAARARRRRRLGQRQQGAGHAGVGGDPGRAALHQRCSTR